MIPKKAIKKVRNDIHLEIAAGSLLAYGVFPQTQEGIQLAKETAASKDTWLAPSDLPEYYDGIDSDLIIGKENDAIRAIRNHLKEFYGISSAGTETAEDTRVPIEPKPVEEVKKTPERAVNHPKLYPELQRIKPRYMWGQRGLFDLTFKSDIDRAIYYAGSSSRNKEGDIISASETKLAVREWIFAVTGLNYYDDFDELKDYRKRILDYIVTGLRSNTIQNDGGDLIIPPIYDGPFDEPDIEEDYDEEEPEGLDDLLDFVKIEEDEEDEEEPNNLDDLLNSVRVEEEPPEDEKEVESQAETATQVLVEAEEAREESIDESVLDDLPDEVRQSLVDLINKRKGKAKAQTEKKSSSYVSNRKILKFLTNNLLKIQGQLDSVNNNIIRQNELLQANLQVSSGIYENIEIQNTIFLSKLDQILQAVGGQSEAAKKFAEDEEKRLAEENLEASRDAASTETAMSTLGGKGTGGNSLLRRLTKFFGKRLGRSLWKRLVPRRMRAKARLGQRGLTKIKSLPKRLAQSFGTRIAGKVLQKPAQVAVKNVAPRAVAKGFEHIALPGVNRAIKNADAPVAKAITNTDNFFVRALKSPIIQKALVNKLGKEGAEKLTVKVAAKLVPGVSTVYGLGEGLARIAMGDVKGGFLSFGSAIPGAGYAFAAVDILRDINIDAYTKHIESNLPNPSNENFAAFFTEALGVTPDQYELGGTTGSQTVMLHGTELLIPPASPGAAGVQSVDPVGGTILAASAQYINKLGSVGAPIAPMFEQVAAPLTKVYNVPSTLVQTNVGGALPSLQSTLSKIKEKKKMTPEEELSAIEKDLLEEQDPKSFADKLLKMIDPEGKFQQLLQQLNQPRLPGEGPDGGVVGDLQGKIVNPMEEGDMQDYAPAKFGADRRGRPGGHMGRDIMGPAGMKVVSAMPGTVKAIMDVAPFRNGKGMSKRIDIDHGNGIVTKYMHIIPSVRIGDAVNAGQKIAEVSPEDTISSGSHLHFELWHGSKAQDPESFLKNSLKLRDIQAGKVPGLSAAQPSTQPTVQGLGRQGVTGNRNFGASAGVGGKGYLIVPGHAAGGGAPEEKKLAKQLAKNAYNNLKSKFPDAKIEYQDTDAMFEDTDAGFKKQLDWFKQKEKEGWEILEVHMDASIESGQGTGRGVIVPTGELNPVEAYFAQNYGAFSRGHRDLGAPKRGVGLFELGNMSPELQQASQQNKVSKQQLDALTAPLERAIQSGLNISPPTQRQSAQSKYYLRQGGDNKADTQIVMIPASSTAGKSIEKNATVEGQRFVYDANYNVFKTQNEVSSVERANLLRRLGLN
jgi:murein DD-endopeptidase MepM/ murein hydrolase activator NlpD